MKVHHSSTSSSDVDRSSRETGPESPGRRALRAFLWTALATVALDVTCRLVLPEGDLVEFERTVRQRVVEERAPDIQIVGDSVSLRGLVARSAVDHDHLRAREVPPETGDRRPDAVRLVPGRDQDRQRLSHLSSS